MMKVQFHLIGRCDDVNHLETEGVRNHELFPDFCLQLQVQWSKNVREERHCPDQLLLGCNDPDFCVLLGLAGHLETKLTDGSHHSCFLFGVDEDDDAAKRLNDQYLRTL